MGGAMGTKAESELKRAVGAADMLELLARAFSYPDTAADTGTVRR